MFFWYYISSFCATYINSQIILIKNSLLSFTLSLIYPFIKYFIPSIIRICALRSQKNKYLYKISLLFQMI